MSAIAAGLDPGILRIRTRIVSSETVSDVCVPVRGPRPQEREVDALRKQLVASGVGRFENIRKVMKPFHRFFILLRIKFRHGTSREVAYNTTLMAINGKNDSVSDRQREDRARSSSEPKTPYRNRRYYLAKNRR